MESPVPIPILPPVASSSRREGSSTSGVPLDSIPHDIESHHEFVEEWASRLSISEALRYGIGWEKVPGEEPRKYITPVFGRSSKSTSLVVRNGSDLV